MADDKTSGGSTTNADNNLLASVIRLGIGAIGSVAGATGLLFALGFLIVNISLSSYGVYETGLIRERYMSTGIAFIFILSILVASWVIFIPSGLERFLDFFGVQKDDDSNHKFIRLLVISGAPIFISLVATVLLGYVWKISLNPSEWLELSKWGRWVIDQYYAYSARQIFFWCMLVSVILALWQGITNWDEVKRVLNGGKVEKPQMKEKTEKTQVREGNFFKESFRGKGKAPKTREENEDTQVGKQILEFLKDEWSQILLLTILLFLILVVYARNVFPALPAAMGGGLPIVVQFSAKDEPDREEMIKLDIPFEIGDENEPSLDEDNQDDRLLTRRVTLIARTGSSYVLLVFHPEIAKEVVVSLPKDHVDSIIYYPEEYSLNEEYRFQRLIQNGGDALTRGENQTAIEEFNKALDKKADSLQAHIGLGDANVAEYIVEGPACEGKDCIDEAIKSYKNALCPTGNFQDCNAEAPAIDNTLIAEALYKLSRAYALQEVTLGLSLSTLNNPFFVTLRDGAQRAADVAGANLTVVDAQDKSAKEATNIENLIQQGVDAILVNPTDADDVVSSIQKANEAGIPVFTIDRSANGGVVVSHITSGNIMGGIVAGEFLCDALGGQGKVVELEGIAETSTARDRGNGFKTYMSNVCPGIKIFAHETANFNRAEGFAVFEKILQEQPEIDGTFAHNDEMILGAIEAAESASRASKITFVGFDATDDAVAAVNAGQLAATIAQQPAEMGRLGIETAVKYLHGEIVGQYIPVELSLVAGDINPEETEAPTEPTEVKLGLSLSTLNNPFFVTLRDGAQAAADAAGAKLTVVDAQDDPAREATNIEDLIQQGVSALLINPTDADAIVPSVQKANEAHIPVFTVDRAANGGAIESHIASDNVAGGAIAGEFLCEALRGAGNVVELEGIVGNSSARDRSRGFNDYMSQECTGVEIVARQTANFNREEGKTVFENILRAQPEIKGVFAHNDEMILGAIKAAEEAGRLEEIIFVGFNAINDAVQSVRDGKLAATIAQQPALTGQLGVMVALRSLGGGSVKKNITTDLSLVEGTTEPKEQEEIKQEETELDFLEIHCPKIKVNVGDSINSKLAAIKTLACAIEVDKESGNPQNYVKEAKNEHIFYLEKTINLRTDDEFINLLFPSESEMLKKEVEVVRRLSMEARDLQESRDYETAVDRYTWAITLLKEPQYNLFTLLKEKPRLYHNRAGLYLELHGEGSRHCEDGNCLGKAMKDYEEAVELEPNNATYLMGLAEALRMDLRLEEAVTTYKRIGLEEAEYELAQLGLGEVYLSQEKNDVAKKAFDRTIERQPGNGAAYYSRAIAEARIGKDLVQAIRDLRQAITLEETYLQKAEDEPVLAPLIETYDFILANQIFEAGQVDERGGNLEDAIQKYQEAIQLDPLNDAFHSALADAYRELDSPSWNEAEISYQKAIDLYPESDIYYLRLGEVYAAQGKYEQAISSFNTATEQSPENDIYHLRLGEVYAAQGKYDQARDAFSKSIDTQPKNAAAYYGRSVAEARIGEDLAQAIRDLLQAIALEETYLQKAEDEPVFAPLIDLNDLILAKQKFEAGQIDERERNLEDAKQKYLEAIELDRLNDVYHAALAEVYRKLKVWNEAEITYNEAINLSPENDNYHFNLGEVYAAQGKYEQAVESFTTAIKLSPDNDNYHFRLGEVYAAQGEDERAIESFSTAIELSPENDVYHFRLGEVYITQGKYEKAIEPFIAAINIDREKAIYYDRLSAVYFKEGFGFVASYAGKQAVKLEPENLDYRLHLAEIYRQIGSWYLAITNYDEILKRNSEYGDAYCGLAMVYYQSGEAEEAEAAFQRCQQLGVNDNLKRQAKAEKARFEG